eukprot:Blabericola_migrator_1__264@NODE_106_length_14174_cov_318_190118_g94_i0_p4_GENE_NODE_106_length_14174_cov_318_190118_g94_i0NODE_106_length_14174_cov_318_190118_g94_i0_p4_ORF_typecomplete_len529_score80_68Asp/PF00026_23/7_5e05_NODE_106_length_14174_cov_318_190118_g94_i067498335
MSFSLTEIAVGFWGVEIQVLDKDTKPVTLKLILDSTVEGLHLLADGLIDGVWCSAPNAYCNDRPPIPQIRVEDPYVYAPDDGDDDDNDFALMAPHGNVLDKSRLVPPSLEEETHREGLSSMSLRSERQGFSGFDCGVLIHNVDAAQRNNVTLPFGVHTSGLVITETRVEGFAHVALSGFNETDMFLERPVKMILSQSSPFPFGRFGISSYGCRGANLIDILLNKFASRTLVYQSSGPKSHQAALAFPSPQDVADLTHVKWTELTTFDFPRLAGLFSLPAYNIRLNNVDLLEATSDHWVAVIQLGTPCLHLPSFLLYRLLSNLSHLISCPTHFFHPVVDEEVPWQQTLEGNYCALTKDISGLKIKFDLSTLGNDTVEIDLRDLVFRNGKNELCILPSREYITVNDFSPLSDTLSPPILLGQMALARHNLYLNYDDGRVGFEEKVPLTISSEVHLPPIECHHNEIARQSSRKCVPIDCGQFQYLSNTMDHPDYLCETKSGVSLALQLFGSLFIFVNMMAKWIIGGAGTGF